MADYDTYSNFVGEICKTGNLTDFKLHPKYRYMLEHVTNESGYQYLTCIQNNTDISNDEINTFCSLNDSVGNPSKTDYHSVITSPSSLRYIYHAHLILSHLQKLNLPPVDIVELGGGYGGLCLSVHHFSEKYGIKINSYTIVDLPNIIQLQSLYLSKVNPDLQVNFVDGTTFGKNIDKSAIFLVSNYCFSEISAEFQKEYIQHLFPKVAHGFMAWNNIPTYNFGFSLKEEREFPHTGGKFNKYVYF